MTLVEFWPLSGISSVIETVEAEEVEDAKTTSEEPLAIPSPTPSNRFLESQKNTLKRPSRDS